MKTTTFVGIDPGPAGAAARIGDERLLYGIELLQEHLLKLKAVNSQGKSALKR